MWTTHDYPHNPDYGLAVIDVSQEGRVIVVEGEGPLQEGDAIQFQGTPYGVRFWDQDDTYNQVPSGVASYRIKSIDRSGDAWIACAEHFPRVIVNSLPPER